jgi:hypothetical protein
MSYRFLTIAFQICKNHNVGGPSFVTNTNNGSDSSYRSKRHPGLAGRSVATFVSANGRALNRHEIFGSEPVNIDSVPLTRCSLLLLRAINFVCYCSKNGAPALIRFWLSSLPRRDVEAGVGR